MAGYERVDVCEAPGQVCLRGGYVDVYPIAAENPVRIEFFGDEIDTLRIYDPLTQRSVDNVDRDRRPSGYRDAHNGRGKSTGTEASQKAQGGGTGLARWRRGRPDNSVALLPLFYPGKPRFLIIIDKDWIILIDEPAAP